MTKPSTSIFPVSALDDLNRGLTTIIHGGRPTEPVKLTAEQTS